MGDFIAKLCRADIWDCGRSYNCKIGEKSYFKRQKFFFLTWGKEILEIAPGVFIAKKERAFILNWVRRVYAKLWSADILISTMWNVNNHVYKNYNFVIVVKFAT